jgi:DNA invertase Pin-like site-specific DNA recombinase
MSLTDAGVSAFTGKHRENADLTALAAFMAAVKAGRVAGGSYLVVESLDRLSREHIRPALTALLNLIEAGVKVVQLKPVEVVYDDEAEPMTLMMAIMELNRGHSESALKSERIGAAWAQKRKLAAETIVTRKLPGWVTVEADRLVLIPEHARTVRHVFDLALEGLGVRRITRRLNEEAAPIIGRPTSRGRAGKWTERAVYHILKSRATIGEFQPRKGLRGNRRRGRANTSAPAGRPVVGYFPCVVSDESFYAVQGMLTGRSTCGRGRRGKHVNLFAGLLKDARSGVSLSYRHVAGRASTIIPVPGKFCGDATWSSFPAAVFDWAILSVLREVRAADVFPDAGGGGRKVEAAAARLAEVEGLIGQWRAKMDRPELVEIVAEKLAELEARRKALASELSAAQNEAASPVAESWGQFRSLAQLLESDAGDELREKVRSALRRAIESIIVFFAKGRPRVCVAQVYFRGGTRRDYLVVHRPSSNNGTSSRPARTNVRSFATPGVTGLDLRRAAHVKRLERVLAELDPAALTAST